jgi:carboxypeptidase C (cathepsin A)
MQGIDKTRITARVRAMRFAILLLLSLAVPGFLTAEEAAPPTQEKPAVKPPEPVVRESTVSIDGKAIPYRVTTGKIQLTCDDGKPRASIFYVSYERSDVQDKTARPVMFAFNGGPGSSAVWLHIGVLGPRIIRLPGDGTAPAKPPVTVQDNPFSILDVCDLVFVDPVSTGYSRTEKDTKPEDFHGLDEDIESVGDFVRRWISEHDRWASPKFLLGESYGGVRVAGLSQHLQSRYGMNLNGVVLLSSLLDFATLQPAPGNDLSHLVFLPAFTATAHFHGKVTGDRAELVKLSTEFAYGAYASALLKGRDLEDSESKALADTLARLTGISAEVWHKRNLRISPTFFRGELLRAEGKVLGRFDSRVAWDATDRAAHSPDYDPSYVLAYGAISTAMLDYLGRELGYKEDQPYEILTGKVHPWRWNAHNSVVNVSNRLAAAMRDNPQLKVHVMGGLTDLATPPEGVAYSLRHLPNPTSTARENFTTTLFEGGHMFYFNPPDLEKSRSDLLDFIRRAQP